MKNDGPTSRARLLPAVVAHRGTLASTIDRVDPEQREAVRQLSEWLARNRVAVRTLDDVVVCTGNSRRSMLGAMMGNAAAAFRGLRDIRFFCAGTAPSAFNPRTIAALRAAGFAIGRRARRHRGERRGLLTPHTGSAGARRTTRRSPSS